MDRYLKALSEGAAELHVPLDPSVADAMVQHHALVTKWAGKVNLTTVLEPERAAILHGLDSLLFAEVFDPAEVIEVVDVGSGAGFPGVILALARPNLTVRLLEPIRKRASFLRVVLADLRIPNAKVVEGRLDPARKGAPPTYGNGAIVSRATVPPLELVPLAGPHLSAEGRLVLSGGQGAPETEELLAAAPAQFEASLRREWVLPSGERRVIEVLKRRP